MKIVIIRDDDINAFTDVKLLEKIYGKSFFSRGFKLSASVIPVLDSSAKIGSKNNSFYRHGYEYEPFIPEHSVGTGIHAFQKGTVAQWLAQTGVEPCLHGYSHNAEEFTSRNAEAVKTRITEGRGIVERATGRRVSVFVPPHERLSKPAWQAVTQSGMQIFRNVIRPLKDITCAVPASEYGLSHVRKEFFIGYNGVVAYRNNKELGTMDPYLFSCFWNLPRNYEDACAKFERSDIFIMANHHWEFGMNPDMFAWWEKFVEFMAQHDFTSFTASEALSKLKPVNA